jgi:hypothetical protein
MSISASEESKLSVGTDPPVEVPTIPHAPDSVSGAELSGAKSALGAAADIAIHSSRGLSLLRLCRRILGLSSMGFIEASETGGDDAI